MCTLPYVVDVDNDSGEAGKISHLNRGVLQVITCHRTVAGTVRPVRVSRAATFTEIAGVPQIDLPQIFIVVDDADPESIALLDVV